MVFFTKQEFDDLVGVYEEGARSGSVLALTEATGKSSSILKTELLDVEDTVRKNKLQPITNPNFFVRDGLPTDDGLLSNVIFGTTKSERANRYAYIDLMGTYMHPLCYKIWSKMDSRIKDICHGSKYYRIENGDFVEDPNGETGFDFLKKHINEIKIRSTESRKRDKNIVFLQQSIPRMFMTKLIVIPAYYRDSNSGNSSLGVGAINKLYATIIACTKALKDTQEYGLGLEEATRGRIQESIVEIYNVLCGISSNPDAGTGLSKKKGYVKMAVMTKTTDYGCRLVISAPELKVETIDDILADMHHAGLPLASALVNFYPFIIFHVKRFFENNFYGDSQLPIMTDKGVVYKRLMDPEVQFSEEIIKEEIDRFIHGYSARFRPIVVKCDDGKTHKLLFTGKYLSAEQLKNQDSSGASPLANRALTWCDVFFMAANESVKGKHITIVRYPIDSCFNTITLKCRITTIKETEHVYVNGEYYRWYPKIREKDIGSNTSSRFIDSLNINNTLLGGAGADYDGDQVSVKGVWTEEANTELDKFTTSPCNYINNFGKLVRESSIDSIQAMYCLTKILDADKAKLGKPKF